MNRTIKHNLFYSHTPEIVWEYLTNSALISQWLMPNDFQPIVGHDFTFRTKPIPLFEFDGIVYCKVLEIIPYKTLSYSWKGGPGNGKINLDSIVVWKLSPKDGGTEVLLEHSGLMEHVNIYNAMTKGWLDNMHKIVTLINARTHGTTKA
jgi:uncharacterized protein YndB with AHSA1/START domain